MPPRRPHNQEILRKVWPKDKRHGDSILGGKKDANVDAKEVKHVSPFNSQPTNVPGSADASENGALFPMG
jgi:hypothetical protein